MITEYHRPQTLEEAWRPLRRPNTPCRLAAGTKPTRRSSKRASSAAVDLQNLGLNGVTVNGHLLEIGATVTLQACRNTKPPLKPCGKPCAWKSPECAERCHRSWDADRL